MRLRHVATGMFTIFVAISLSTVVLRAESLDLPVPDFSAKPPEPKEDEAHRAANEAKYNKPIYNPETKSYFEFYVAYKDPLSGISPYYGFEWLEAKKFAETRTFHGVRGRLAVIKTKSVNDFVVEKVKPDTGTWIGLEYICQYSALRWSSGEFWPTTAYQNWNRPWNVEGTSPLNHTRAKCGSDEYHMQLGVHYWGPEGNFKWNANGTAKGFKGMIIEYPTGKP